MLWKSTNLLVGTNTLHLPEIRKIHIFVIPDSIASHTDRLLGGYARLNISGNDSSGYVNRICVALFELAYDEQILCRKSRSEQ
jgi:hypothetical protein